MSYPFSNYKDDDITLEVAKLDEMMSSIAKEIEDETSLAASVVTAFLKKEHDLVEQNAGGYPSIIQVHNQMHPVIIIHLILLIGSTIETASKL